MSVLSLDVTESGGRGRLDLIFGMRGVRAGSESDLAPAPANLRHREPETEGDLLDDHSPAPPTSLSAFNQKSSH